MAEHNQDARRGRRRRAAAQPRRRASTSTAARAPTPTCSTARPPSRPTARWSSSTRAAARPTCCGPVMFAIMEYVTHTVERHWARAAVTLDAERARRCSRGARSCSSTRPGTSSAARETGEYANDLARRARHLGLVLIVMSQQLSDFDTEHGLALLQNSTMQMLLAQHPNELPVHPRRAAALRRGGAAGRAAQDGQGQPRAAAVDQRHPRPRPRRAARRPDRVLGLHLRPGRRRAAARRQARRARRRRRGRRSPTSPGSAATPRASPPPRAEAAMAVSLPALRPRPRHHDREDAPERGAARAAAAQRMREAPLLAVCGLCGGAGASTLSYLLARFAVRELDGPCARLRQRLDRRSRLARRRRVSRARSAMPPRRSPAGCRAPEGSTPSTSRASDRRRELRVIATGPRFDSGGDPDGVQALLSLARQRRCACAGRGRLRNPATGR